jgi:hypothetical protein
MVMTPTRFGVLLLCCVLQVFGAPFVPDRPETAADDNDHTIWPIDLIAVS